MEYLKRSYLHSDAVFCITYWIIQMLNLILSKFLSTLLFGLKLVIPLSELDQSSRTKQSVKGEVI